MGHPWRTPHPIEQVALRYDGLAIDRATRRSWERALAVGKGRLVRKESCDRRVYDLPHEGRTIRLVYSRRLGRVMTALAPDMLPKADLEDAWRYEWRERA